MRELPRLRPSASWAVATLQNARPKVTSTCPIIIRRRSASYKEMGQVMLWLPSTESSAKSSLWRTIVIPNASLGRSLSESSRAGESFFLAMDLWYCSAASCNLGDAAKSRGWCKVRAGIEQAHRCSPSLRRSISCSSSLASPVRVVLSLALMTSSAHFMHRDHD